MGSRQPQDERGQEAKRGEPVPAIEIAVPEIGKEAAETRQPAPQQQPPGPRLSLPQRPGGKPAIEQPDRDECPAEGDAIMNHEMDDAAAVNRAELFGRQPQEMHIVRQKLPGRREVQGKHTGENQTQADQEEPEPPLAKEAGAMPPPIEGRARHHRRALANVIEGADGLSGG